MRFADDVRARLPDGMVLPQEFADTFDWIEAQGWTDTIPGRPVDDLSARNLYIYPEALRSELGASIVVFGFEAGPPMHAPPPEAIARVTTVATIAGDGGTLSLWLDDDGKQWIVVFDHGYPFVLTDDPLKALQFLAIGYPEPATEPFFDDDPVASAEREGFDPPILPHEFRAFLTERFQVEIPGTAAALGLSRPEDDARDPVRDWMDGIVSGAPTRGILDFLLGRTPD